MPVPGQVIRFFFIFLLEASGLAAQCQNENIGFWHLGTEQGLSQSNVTCILQDSRGLMWFGTQDGLSKYDSYQFTVYKVIQGDTAAISNNEISGIAEDAKGNLWIGTLGGGLNMFDWEKQKFVQYKWDSKRRTGICSDYINSVTIDGEGFIWLGTTLGLNKLDPRTGIVIVYSHSSSIPGSINDDDVTDVLEDRQHRLWASTFNNGLNLLDRATGKFTHFLHNEHDSNSLSHNHIRRLFEGGDGRLCLATWGGGLDLFDPARGVFHHYRNDPRQPNSLPNNMILSIANDEKGDLWIGTENGGLCILNVASGRSRTYIHDEIDGKSLTNNSIYSIYKDTRGNMWVGTYSAGVNYYNKDANSFAHYKHNGSIHSLTDNDVLSLYEDVAGNIWIGTDGGGLNLFDRQNNGFTHVTSFKKGSDIIGKYVMCVREDKNKNIWIGTYGDGITVLNPSRQIIKHFTHRVEDSLGLSDNTVCNIVRDKQDDLWIGTTKSGMDMYDPGKNNFAHYKHDNSRPGSICSDRIMDMICDSKGRLWIGTRIGGLDLFDKKTKTFTHFVHDNKKNSISNNIINCIHEDRNGYMWIGTGFGLNRLDCKTNQFIAYFTGNGLPDNYILGILEDNKGNLWISTNNGLSRFNPLTGIFKNFTVGDGLQSNEFKPHSCLKSASGAMYFGGVNGFNAFFPDSIKSNPFEPSLMITGFQIFNKEVAISGKEAVGSPLEKDISETKEVTLSYKQSVISFEFASLNYTIPEKKQYAYMLEGFDKKWNNIGVRRTATYTNLDAGQYVFRVKGLRNDGSWSPVIAGIKLIITPPFWMTWWFRLLAVILVASGVIIFYKIRIRAIKAQKRELEQRVVELDKAVAQGKFEIASDVLHDIGNALVGFGSYLTRITRLQEQGRPENLEKLAVFFESQRPAMATAIGEVKSGAVVNMLNGIAQTQKLNQEEIGKSVAEQFNIINHIQEILHIQRQYITRKESQERKPVIIRNIINDCKAMLLSSIEKNAVAVTVDVPADLPLIKGDRTRLMQVFLQVFRNSLEAIGMDAPVKTISVRVYTEPGGLVLEIRDSGQGFDGSVSARLFEKGFTTNASGAGMGLYNCRDILESHEGSIDITSEGSGKGALALIRLPFVQVTDEVILSVP